ncbi:invasin domain 3-containing protein, partial [Reichenbachiella sp. MALMAid0571]|uniref:invasin domain 3-containing protein n=1 Tax=Reichenbachiella sp. MALMAid0571 TaxID=3143939 RepID=UPI0032DE74BE
MIKHLRNIQLLIVCTIFSLNVLATDITVTTINDSGAGSLRQAITDINAAGAGPHSIVFDVALSGSTITILSDLPIISVPNVTIDGIGDGSGNITIDGNGGDITRYVFRADATGDFATFRNFIIQNTGYQPFSFSGSPTDITIENIVALHTGGNYFNYGIYYAGNALNLTVLNFTMTQQQNIGHGAIYISGTATNVLIDNFDLSDSGGGGIIAIRFGGAANNVTIQNCDIDLDLTANGNDGDYGVLFSSTATDITLTDNTFTNIDAYALYFASTTTNVDINGFQFINDEGGTTAFGMRFVGVADDISMTNVELDLDHSTTTDDGDYGIYFNTTTSNVTIDGLTIHDAEVYGIFIGGVSTDISIINSTFDNFDGYTGNQMIRFNGVVNGITLTNVDIDLNITDNGASLDDGDYGIYFYSHINDDETKNAVFTDVTINQADSHGLYTRLEVNNLTIDDCTFSGNSETNTANYGVEFDNNYQKKNITVQNSTFTNLSSAAMEWDMRGANSTSNLKILNNTISGTVASSYAGYGVWLYYNNSVVDLDIIGNTFFDNAAEAISIREVDGVHISQNSMYNNLAGIDNLANNGNNDLEQLDGDTPRLMSSIDAGSGNYEVTFTLPAFCTDCDVEFFTNQVGDKKYNGRTYTDVATGLSGVGPHIVTVSGGGATDGFWTTTLKDNTQNGSVSEFSSAVAINPKGPANVDAGIALWARADISGQADGNFTVGNGWLDFSGNENHYEQAVASDPELVSNVINFNHSVVFDGNDYLNQLNVDLNAFPTGNDDRTVFIVSKITTTSSQTAFSYGVNTTSQNQSWRYENGTLRYIGWSNDFTGAGAFTVNEPFIGRYDHNGTTASINSDGREVSTSARTYNTQFSSGSSHIGVRIGTAGEAFIGDISEVIVYNRNLTDAEKDRIESYLALKYGITLDQTVATDYFASDGTTKVWDATVNAAYTNDVTGIGRDDDGFFNQKQSKSINVDDIVTIGLGAIAVDNPTNANTLAADKNFLVWGNDDGSTDLQSTELSGAASAAYRLAREWKVSEIGNVSNLTIAFDNVSSLASNIELLIDTDGDGNFTNASVITGGVVIGGKATFTGVDLNDGDVFTLAYTAPSPGGVISDLRLWLRADQNVFSDAGVTLANDSDNVEYWTDVTTTKVFDNSSNGAGAQSFNSITKATNFNPSIEFNSSGYLGRAFDSDLNSDDISIFTVDKPDNVTASSLWSFNRHNNTSNNGGRSFYYSSASLISIETPYPNTGSGGHVFDTYPNLATIGNIAIHGMIMTGSSTPSATDGAADYYFGGAKIETYSGNQSAAQQGVVGSYYLGARRDGNNTPNYFYGGAMSEHIRYTTILTDAQVQRVNTYLAIKYGSTLDADTDFNTTPFEAPNGDGINEGDYVLSDGTTIVWDASANQAYHNNIAGIGRDDLSALNQKQSQSVNEGEQVLIGTTGMANTNADNAGTFTDGQFLLWGDNGLEKEPIVSLTGINGVNNRFPAIWKVSNTGSLGTVRVMWPEEGLNSLKLIQSSDATFDGTDIATDMSANTQAINGVTYNYADVTFTDGQYFTFASFVVAPGGVVVGLDLWLDPNVNVVTSGSSVTQWSDKESLSVNNPVLAQGTTALLPTFNSGTPSSNFNPYIDFTGKTRLHQTVTGSSYAKSHSIFAAYHNNQASPGSIYAHFMRFSSASNSDGGSHRWGFGYNTYPGANSVSIHYISAPFASGGSKGNYTTYQYNQYNTSKEWATGTTGIISAIIDQPGSQTIVGFDGDESINNVTINNAALSVNNYLTVGGGSTYGQSGWGQEIIEYSVVLSQTDRQKINSYLAIKYGSTLSHNYLASDATPVWTLGGGYDNDIFGIARDDNSGLDQRVSKSILSDAVVTIALDNDFISANNDAGRSTTHTSDMQFLVIGNNGGTLTNQSSELDLLEYQVRLVREWRVDNTGSVGAVNLKFDGFNEDWYLVTTTDGDFSSSITTLGQLDANGELTGVTLLDGVTFTLARFQKAPGGVTANLGLWLKTDNGVFDDVAGTDPAVVGDEVSYWQDQSFIGIDVVERNAAPTLVVGNQTNNFINTLDFAAANAELVNLTTATFAASQDGSVFTIASQPTTSGYNSIIGFGTAGTGGQDPQLGTKDALTNIFDGSDFQPAEGTFIPNKLSLFDYSWSSTDATIGYDGNRGSKGSAHVSTDGTIETTIGGDSDNGGEDWEGLISEIVVYTDDLFGTDLQKVQSYMALKYGITLDQTSATNYIASNGSPIWTNDGTETNGTFDVDVFGIGRDDASELDQRISRSSNSGAIVTIALDNDFATTNNDPARTTAHTNDLQFLTVANDGGVLTLQTSELDIAVYQGRIAREWKVDNTGSVGAVNLKFDGFGQTAATTYYLISDADGDFSSGYTQLGPLDANGEITGVTLADDLFFTLAAVQISPGGVGATARLWFKADDNGGVTTDGTDITNWVDKSDNNATTSLLGTTVPPTAASTIKYNTSDSEFFNFNTTIEFTREANNQGYGLSTPSFSVGDNISVFMVYKANLDNSVSVAHGNIFKTEYAGVEAFNGTTQNIDPASTTRLEYRGFTATRNDAGSSTIYDDGSLASFTNVGNVAPISSDFVIGHDGTANVFDGNIAEIIYYDSNIDIGVDVQRVQSYFALKYGITLDQSTGTGYIASDGVTKMWDKDASDAATHNNDIFGIGRDDASALGQLKSKSINSDAIVTLLAEGESTDDSNLPTSYNFTDIGNREFLTIGNNDGAATFTATGAPTGLNILSRQWSVQESGEVGTLQLDFNMADAEFDVPATTQSLPYFLIVDTNNDGSLADETPVSLIDQGSDIWRITGLDLNDGNEFTLAIAAPVKEPYLGYVPFGGGNFTIAPTAAGTDSNITGVDIHFTPDGMTAYVLGDDGTSGIPSGEIREYNATTAFDVTTLSSTGKVFDTGFNGVYGTRAEAFTFSSDGTKMFVLLGAGTIEEYFLGTAYDVINAYYTGSGQSLSTGLAEATAIEFNNTGTIMLVSQASANLITEYSLTAFDVSTAVVTGNTLSGVASDKCMDIFFNQDGTILYEFSSSGGDKLVGRTLSTSYDITTVISTSVSVDPGLSIYSGTIPNNTGFGISSDGIRLYGVADLGVGNSVVATTLGEYGENLINDGSIDNATPLTIHISGDQLSDAGTTLTHTSDYIITNLPAGLTPALTVAVNGYSAVLTFTGTATNHDDSENVNSLNFQFTNSAFVGADASIVTNSGSGAVHESNVPLNFLDNTAPGGVAGNLSLWLKADVGVTGGATVTQWDDQSVNENNATASDGNPDGTSSTANFNTTLTFSTNQMDVSAPGGLGVNGDYEIFAVGSTSSNSQQELLGSTEDQYNLVVNNGTGLEHTVDGTTSVVGNIGDYSMGISRLFSARIALGTNIARINGLDASTTQAGASPGDLTTLPIGVSGTGTNHWDGDISEVIIYGEDGSVTDRQRIESYLALKYGITLDQTAPQDYLASDGTTEMWDKDATNASSYNNDIFGIGRDDNSALSQKQSKSVNSDALVTLALGAIAVDNTSNASTFGADLNFLTVGNNNGSIAEFSTTGAPANYEILGRSWLVHEEGAIGNVEISIPANSSSLASKLPATLSNVYLIKSTDTNFSDDVPELMTLNGTDWELTLDLSDGEYFTIAAIPILVEFTDATSSDDETLGGNLPSLTVQGGIILSDATVEVAFSGTAIGSTDYAFNVPSPVTVTIPAADYSMAQTVDIVGVSDLNLSITDDNTPEPNETIILTLQNPGTSLSIGDADGGATTEIITTYTITDDDPSATATGTLISGVALTRVADGSEEATITVQLKNENGDDLALAGVEIQFATTLGTLSSTGALQTDASGQVSVTLTSMAAGTADVTAQIDTDNDDTVDDTVVNGSPVQVVFTPGSADPTNGNTTIAATSPVVADGASTSTVTVQLADAQGNLLTASGGT